MNRREPRHPPDRGDRRTARRDPDVGQASCRREDVVDVEERLAHSHVDRMVYGLAAPEVERLVDDLRRGQVSAEAHRAGRAERARERAARLRGEAQRSAAVAVAHEHRFDGMPVRGIEEHLYRPVARFALGDELEGREGHRLDERRAERLRQRRHVVVRRRAARSPLPHLAGAIGGLVVLGECLLQEGQVHGADGSVQSRDRPSLRHCDAANGGDAPCHRRGACR